MVSHETYITIRKYITFVLGVSFTLLAGVIYLFGSLSTNLAASLDVPNADLAGSMGDLGNFLAIIGGTIFDRAGYKVAITYSFVLSVTGYLLNYLTTIGYIEKNLWSTCIYFFLTGQAHSTAVIVGLSMNIKNFGPKNRGTVSGILVSCFVISPVLFLPIYTVLLNSNIANYFLMMTIIVAVIYFISIFLLKDVEEYVDLTEYFIPNADGTSTPSSSSYTTKKEEEKKNITFPTLLTHQEFYLLLAIMFCTVGSSFMWKNILGTVNLIVLPYDSASTTSAMILAWSVIDAGWRTVNGILQDKFSHRIPRPTWIILPSFIMFCGHFCYLIFGDSVLWFLTAGTALGTASAFGSTASLHPLYWGTGGMGVNWGLLLTAPAVGTTLLTFVATNFISDPTCSRDHGLRMCLQYIFVISSVLSFCGFLATLLLANYHRKYWFGK